jgi:hypothetical protein
VNANDFKIIKFSTLAILRGEPPFVVVEVWESEGGISWTSIPKNWIYNP